MRSDSEIRTDIEAHGTRTLYNRSASDVYTRSPEEERLADDVGPLLERAVAAEQERGTLAEVLRSEVGRRVRAEGALAAVRDVCAIASGEGNHIDRVTVVKVTRILAAAEQPEDHNSPINVHNPSLTGLAGRLKPCTYCNGSGTVLDRCCGHVTVLGESCPAGCCEHGQVVD